jgi:hypothetical protein
MYGQKKLWFGSAALFLAFAIALAGCQQAEMPTTEEAATGEASEPSDAAAPAPAPADQRAAAPRAPQPSSAASSSSAAPAPRPAAPRSITLDAGTPLTVRTTSTISTKSHKAGDTFAASLEEPLAEGNMVIAPKGSSVVGRIVESDPGGRVSGVAHITVALDSIETADGQTVSLDTNPLRIEARSTATKDAAKVGIATGIGAAIGAIAGGGKGAGIGAATGAGAGTGVVLATRGDAAEIASESVLDFQLTSPVTITEARE